MARRKIRGGQVIAGAIAAAVALHAAVFAKPIYEKFKAKPEPIATARIPDVVEKSKKDIKEQEKIKKGGYKKRIKDKNLFVKEFRECKNRKCLVDAARKLKEKGELSLGAFVIHSNRIRSAENKKPLHTKKAEEIYAGYVEKLKKVVREGKTVREAIPKVFSDISYSGEGNVSMVKFLETRKGPCEPTAQLITSIVYDAGFEDNAHFRAYGANRSGWGHLAPIFVDGKIEFDLQAGRFAKTKGVKFHASKLVDLFDPDYCVACEFGQGFGTGHGFRDIGRKRNWGFDGGFGYPPSDESFAEGDPPDFVEKGIGEVIDEEIPDGEDFGEFYRDARPYECRPINPNAGMLLAARQRFDSIVQGAGAELAAKMKLTDNDNIALIVSMRGEVKKGKLSGINYWAVCTRDGCGRDADDILMLHPSEFPEHMQVHFGNLEQIRMGGADCTISWHRIAFSK